MAYLDQTGTEPRLCRLIALLVLAARSFIPLAQRSCTQRLEVLSCALALLQGFFVAGALMACLSCVVTPMAPA
jgi:TctA family transporter